MKIRDLKELTYRNLNSMGKSVSDGTEVVIENYVGTAGEWWNNLPDYGWPEDLGEADVADCVVQFMLALESAA
jgi:hypothetical protein